MKMKKRSYFDLSKKIFLGVMFFILAACFVVLFLFGDFSASSTGDAFWSYWFVFNSFHPSVGTYYLLLLT